MCSWGMDFSYSICHDVSGRMEVVLLHCSPCWPTSSLHTPGDLEVSAMLVEYGVFPCCLRNSQENLPVSAS